MPAVARVGDSVTGTCKADSKHGSVTGTIVTGSPDTFEQNIPISRIGDTVTFSCGHSAQIVSGSPNVFVNDIPVARVGDNVDGDVSGVIITGSDKFFVNDNSVL